VIDMEKKELDMSSFCHCHSLKTAVTTAKDLETGMCEAIVCCKRCHPKASAMIVLVNEFLAGKRAAPDFTPDQVIEVALKEDYIAWDMSKTRDKQIEMQNEMKKQSKRLRDAKDIKWVTAPATQ